MIFAYPMNSGGRPLNSWPIFLLAPFEVGMLAAGLAELHRLPRPLRPAAPGHHPLFDWDQIEQATDDGPFLLMAAPEDEQADTRLRALLLDAKALRMEQAAGMEGGGFFCSCRSPRPAAPISR